jgi:hypothetical protein
MSLYDDMFDLDDFFKRFVKYPDKIALYSQAERKAYQKAWKKVEESHGDLERYEMKAERVTQALKTIFDTYGIVREVKEE